MSTPGQSVTPLYEMYEQLSFNYIYYRPFWQPPFSFQPHKPPSGLFTCISVTVLFYKLYNLHSIPTFKTEALCLVSNVQLVKGLLSCNELQTQCYLAHWQLLMTRFVTKVPPINVLLVSDHVSQKAPSRLHASAIHLHKLLANYYNTTTSLFLIRLQLQVQS